MMILPNSVTAEHLREKGAKCSEVERFEAIFPGGAELSLENCLKAAHERLDLCWFAYRFLPPQLFKDFAKGEAQLFKAFAEGKAQLFKDFAEGEAQLWKAFAEGEPQLFKDFAKGKAQLFKDFAEGEPQLFKAFDEGEAQLFKAFAEGEAQLLFQILKVNKEVK